MKKYPSDCGDRQIENWERKKKKGERVMEMQIETISVGNKSETCVGI